MPAGMRARTGVSLACAVVVCFSATPALACMDRAAAPRRAEYSVGYASLGALRTAAAEVNATVVRRVPDLRVARVRLTAAASARLSRSPGIRFVERATRRIDAVEPALLTSSGKTTP